MIDRDFWRGRRVFVTGHTGFKGSWMIVLLRALGADPVGFALPPPTDPSLFDLLGLDAVCDHHVGRIEDLAAVAAALRASGAEIVFHLAAQPLVRQSYHDPVATYAANLMGTVNLLEACRTTPAVRTIVCITTDKVYENVGLAAGYRETDRLGGHDPYSNSKACAELAVAAYRDSFFAAAGVGVASARGGNVIGGGDFAADRILPDAVRSFAAGMPLRIRNPLAIRPWQHVLDPVGGYLLLGQRLHADRGHSGGWNFGPPPTDAASVGDIATRLAGLWGDGARWEQDAADHPHEAHLLTLDPGKAERELGWRQVIDLDNSLRLTIDWYRGWAAGGDIRAVVARQSAAFLERVAG